MDAVFSTLSSGQQMGLNLQDLTRKDRQLYQKSLELLYEEDHPLTHEKTKTNPF